MLGIDYSKPSIELCKKIASTSKGEEASKIPFEVVDFLLESDRLLEQEESQQHRRWDLICDKGTVSVSEVGIMLLHPRLIPRLSLLLQLDAVGAKLLGRRMTGALFSPFPFPPPDRTLSCRSGTKERSHLTIRGKHVQGVPRRKYLPPRILQFYRRRTLAHLCAR